MKTANVSPWLLGENLLQSQGNRGDTNRLTDRRKKKRNALLFSFRFFFLLSHRLSKRLR